MTTVQAKVDRRIAGLYSTFQCIIGLAENAQEASTSNTSRVLATTRLELLEAEWIRFKSEHAVLLDMNCENLQDQAYFRESVEAQCLQAYETAKVAYLTIKEHYDRTEPTGALLADVSAAECQAALRRSLPEIKLKTFSGEFSKWREFHDMFVSMVGENTYITSVEKMQYLRTSLKGEAAQLVSNLPISASSFAAAWDILVERYENKRLLITAQLDCLLGIPNITTRSGKALNNLLNTLSEVLHALQALEVPIQSWDCILVHIVASKLDQHLREQWEVKLGAAKEPATLQQLRDFLNTRARALESIEIRVPQYSSRQSSTATPSPKTATSRTSSSSGAVKAYTSQVPSKGTIPTTVDHKAAMASTKLLNPGGSATQCCHYCLSQHFIAKCPNFKQRTPQERRTIAEQRRLCFNCLGPHSAVNCKVTGRCAECGGKHHTLIHTGSISATPSPPAGAPHLKPSASSSPNEPQA
ncbi:uncharacterized protein [Venturia canescens]|uniref:uncharacterized protein n=1 Tax=Venturia canescens TaxID=32260 RepID=UPI001C9BEAD8|nr:uncharacterized protein LOC122416248 [Venturia canescens]